MSFKWLQLGSGGMMASTEQSCYATNPASDLQCGTRSIVQPAGIKHHPLPPSLLTTCNAGERGNDDFLLHYGFVPPRNPHDDVSLFTGAALLQTMGLVGIVPRCSIPQP